MDIVLIVVLLLLAVLHAYRQYWNNRLLPRVSDADFEGELFRVGDTVIARRPASGGDTRTIICHPGFLEDMRYFQALYADTTAELILVNNADYHSPFAAESATGLDWPVNPFPLGTIEHDGFYLGLVLERLATGSDITLHGHSRGGAVVLEMGRQYRRLVKGAERSVAAILEAPVLPGARTVGRGSEPVPHALICYLLPIVLGLGRKSTREQLLKQPMMRPTNDLKTALCLCVYTNAKRYRTCVANVRSIRRWQRNTDPGVYANFARVAVVVGERDDVLDNDSMVDSAERGLALNPGVTILRTEDTNHFVSLERPEYLLALHEPKEAAA